MLNLANNQASFSIVVPIYNGEKYLSRCIESILSQTYGDYEVVFVDDGSTDKSIEIIESFSDSRFRLLRQTNQGVSAARNVGVKESRNPFIAFLDADDEWLPNHLETLAFLTSQHKDGGVYSTGFRLEYEDGSPSMEMFVDTNKEPWMVCEDPFPIWSVGATSIPSNSVVRKDVLEEAGGFQEGEPENEDMDLWVRIGVRRPLVVSSDVTCVHHQVGSVGKPRFRKWPQYILSCRTAGQILLNEPKGLVYNPHSVREYIRGWTGIYFWSFVYSNAREPLKILLTNSGAATWAPIYIWLVRTPGSWPVLRLFALLRRLFNSKLLQQFMGGTKRRKGVVTRLSKANARSWILYVRKKRRARSIHRG